ncbi:phosphodiester glycosidase family protein [Rhizobium grahamii]|nr:phosphodiester glycosidase family protein [Rhizobium grahamii]
MNFKQGMLAGAAMLCAAAFGGAAAAEPCVQDTFEDEAYIVCTVEKGSDHLRLFWKNEDGQPYRDFSGVAAATRKSGQNLVFAINAGMYLTDFSPIGLYIEDGKELRPASTARSDGPVDGPVPNFYKRPNGVFFINGTSAGILPTQEFLKRRPDVRIATQSGPMLVINNKLNPIFIVGSTDKTRRGGVGICGDDVVRFAISEDRVNFHDFARLFRDHLACRNALFLDGGRGVGLYSPALGRNDKSWHGGFGPMLGLVE